MVSKLELQSDIQLMEQEGAYDAACKRVLMHKEVLAFILKYVVSEYKDYSLEQIIEYIEKNRMKLTGFGNKARETVKVKADKNDYINYVLKLIND